ncbi:MAG: hypothetical protein AB3N20_18450 [Rhizobiaceae bacterium]
MAWIVRILKSTFALPVWVLVWIFVFLLPANFAGFWFLDTDVGFWVSVLGAGAIIVNMIPVLVNGGVSKVLAIPHLIFWIPLEIILLRLVMTGDLATSEWRLAIAVLIINGISLGFDFYDTAEWWKGNRKVVGYEDEPVRL